MDYWLGVGVLVVVFLYYGVKYLYRSMRDQVEE